MNADMEKLREALERIANDATPDAAAYESRGHWMQAIAIKALAQLSPSSGEGSCFECGHELHAPFCPACNPEMVSAGSLGTSSGEGGEEWDDRFWLLIHEPGLIPERKGPWREGQAAEVLREFIKTCPDAYIDIVRMGHDGPEIEHGPEWLQMIDGRSMSTGRAHNQRTRTAHADVHARLALERRLEAAEAALPAAPVSPALAEEVARIVDPPAWMEQSKTGVHPQHFTQRRGQAIAKANAIIPVVLKAFQGVGAGEPKPILAHHNRHAWAQPGDEPNRWWMLRFADQDMREMVWSGPDAETEARAAYDKYCPAWNCYLFATVAALEGKAP